ncbi:MAG TPA: isochorismatase family protein [Herpetosiphonaceae bacterium]
MALPSIVSYDAPASLPANKVDWLPDPRRAALLIHDMQNYFLRVFAPGAEPLGGLLANIDALRQRCYALGVPVIYSAQPGGQTPVQRGLLQDFWGPGIGTDPSQAAIVDALAPRAGDTLLTKWRYSAFQRTDLLDLLRAQGRDQLLICGIYGHIGVQATAVEAFMLDLQPFLAADAVADFSAEDHARTLAFVAARCGVVRGAAELIGQLGAGSQDAPTPALSLERLRADVAAVLESPAAELEDDANLIDWGLDSIRLMTLAEQWRREGAELAFVDLAERPSLAAWHELLAAATA